MQKWGNENKHAEMTNMNNLKFAQKLGLITLLLLVIFLIFWRGTSIPIQWGLLSPLRLIHPIWNASS